MRNYMTLSKLLIIDFFSRYGQQLNLKGKVASKLVLVLPLLIAVPVFQMVYIMFKVFDQIGFPELTVTYMYLAAVPLIFIMAFPLVISIFFYAKDLNLLSSLPLKAWQIVLAKLTAIYASVLAVSTLILGPAVYYYSLFDVVRPLGILLGIVAILLAPMMPLALAVVLLMPLMRFLAGKKRRNMWVLVGNILLIALILGFQMGMVKLQTDPTDASALLMQKNGLLHFLGQKFPPSIWLTKMVMGSGLHTALFILLQGAVLLVTLVLSKALYLKTVIHYNQVAQVAVKEGSVSYKRSKMSHLLIKRHIGIILNNPTFLLNIVLTMFLPLLMLVITSFTGEFQLSMLKDPSVKPYLLYLFVGVLISPGFMSTLSATAITREGKTFWETRALPISTEVNMQARIMTSNVMTGGASLVLGILSVLFMPLRPAEILLGLLACVVITHFFSTVDLFINIQRPYLNWSSPTAAIKNNLNIIIALGYRILLSGMLFVGAKLVMALSPMAHITLLTLVFALLFLGVKVFLYPVFVKKFTDMDV